MQHAPQPHTNKTEQTNDRTSWPNAESIHRQHVHTEMTPKKLPAAIAAGKAFPAYETGYGLYARQFFCKQNLCQDQKRP
jgi:hypothetical protein